METSGHESVYSELTRESSRERANGEHATLSWIGRENRCSAERLQEKGPIKQSLKYYQQILKAYPDCTEATENARMTQDMLKEEDTLKEKLPKIQENTGYTTTEMEVHWTNCENVQFDILPDPEKAAFDEARHQWPFTRLGHLRAQRNTLVVDSATKEAAGALKQFRRCRVPLTCTFWFPLVACSGVLVRQLQFFHASASFIISSRIQLVSRASATCVGSSSPDVAYNSTCYLR